jgi:hypothetical protein
MSERTKLVAAIIVSAVLYAGGLCAIIIAPADSRRSGLWAVAAAASLAGILVPRIACGMVRRYSAFSKPAGTFGIALLLIDFPLFDLGHLDRLEFVWPVFAAVMAIIGCFEFRAARRRQRELLESAAR